jgi:hypothetical protein
MKNWKIICDGCFAFNKEEHFKCKLGYRLKTRTKHHHHSIKVFSPINTCEKPKNKEELVLAIINKTDL